MKAVESLIMDEKNQIPSINYCTDYESNIIHD